ncbi:tol-pal system protein YbgF [archaeon]|nr:tol-pal system protein YbgF [archaeon]
MKRSAAILIVCAFLAGCATQQDLNAVKWETEALKTRVAKAEDKLKEKERLTEQGLGQQAELIAKYNELKEQLSSLSGGIEELKASSRGIKEERLASMEKDIREMKALLEASKQPAKSHFETGLEKFRAGRFPEAMADMKSYLASHPDPSLVDDAHFWIGESLYAQGKYEDAVIQYDTVSKKFPKGDKVPDALLKQGMSFYQMEDSETGNLVLERLVHGYPNSDAAARAKKIMKEGIGKG